MHFFYDVKIKKNNIANGTMPSIRVKKYIFSCGAWQSQ